MAFTAFTKIKGTTEVSVNGDLTNYFIKGTKGRQLLYVTDAAAADLTLPSGAYWARISETVGTNPITVNNKTVAAGSFVELGDAVHGNVTLDEITIVNGSGTVQAEVIYDFQIIE